MKVFDISIEWGQDAPSVEDLLGKTLISVERGFYRYEGDDAILFTCSDGDRYIMYHSQDCCESVYLEDVCGDFDDLLNSPLLMAEEISNIEEPSLPEYVDSSYTWTFYKFATIKGYVTLRWFGTSNGYYSEEARIEKVENE